jgi:hypothetical protein
MTRLTRLVRNPYLGPVVASVAILLVAVWLDRQFDTGRSSFRAISALTVVWISVAALTVVTIVWVLASFWGRRSRSTGPADE